MACGHWIASKGWELDMLPRAWAKRSTLFGRSQSSIMRYRNKKNLSFHYGKKICQPIYLIDFPFCHDGLILQWRLFICTFCGRKKWPCVDACCFFSAMWMVTSVEWTTLCTIHECRSGMQTMCVKTWRRNRFAREKPYADKERVFACRGLPSSNRVSAKSSPV